MSFWNLSDGSDAKEVGSSFEQAGGPIEPLPDNTDVIAIVEEIQWRNYYESDARHISIKWRVSKPEAYSNRVIFHKLNVLGEDPSKSEEKNATARDKAIRMLSALFNMHGKQLPSGEPTDENLQKALQNKSARLKVMAYDMPRDDGGRNKGNWIAAVSPPKGAVAEAVKPVAKPVEDDEIPF